MQPILCFGEALVDCLQTDKKEVDGLFLPQFTHFPGGAPANVAVAVAKLGGDAYFAGQVGQDDFGDFLKQALERYGVKTSQCYQHATAPTPLAFVLLDEDGERSFTFYRKDTADLVFQADMIQWHEFATAGVMHICSNTLTTDAIHATTLAAINAAKSQGWKISFDINYRHNLWEQPELAPARIIEIIQQSDIVKASGEELEMLYAKEDIQALINAWSATRYVIMTDGGSAVNGFYQGQTWTTDVPEVTAVDTTSAGDSFVGGLLYQLASQDAWSYAKVIAAVEFAVKCGAITVTRQGAYPALPWAEEVLA